MKSKKFAGLVVALLWLGLPALSEGPASTEDLMKQMLGALEAKDQSALTQLAITKIEFKKYFWPTIVSPGDSTTAEQFYKMFEKSNQLGITERLRDLGGQKWQLVKVAFGSEAKKGKGVRLLSNPEMTIRDGNGQEKTVRIAAGVLEHDGN